MRCMWPLSTLARFVASWKLNVNVFSIGRNRGLHARLIADRAVVGEQEAVRAVQVNHADHIFLAEDFTHHGRTVARDFERYLHRLPFRSLPIPRARHCLYRCEGLLGVSLSQYAGGERRNQCDH